MGACAILPRIIGQGRAADLLFTGRSMSADEGDRWGFHNRIVDAGALLAEAQAYAANLAKGLTRSEEHTSELQSLLRISYAVFCLQKKTPEHQQTTYTHS